MKLEMLMNKRDKFTELIRITDFDSIEHCLEVIDQHFGFDSDCPTYTNEQNEKDYKYIYLANDGQAYFVEQLTEFSDRYNDEQSWGVVHSISMN